MALVLGRHKGQSIMIGDDIVVTVSNIDRNGSVRLAIDAPRSVDIYREEIFNRVKAEKPEALSEDQKNQRARSLMRIMRMKSPNALAASTKPREISS